MSEVVAKPSAGKARRLSAVKSAAVLAAGLLWSFPAPAVSPSCPRELGHTDGTLIRSFLHLRGVVQARGEQQCAAYRQHVAVVTKVHEILDRCLSGARRDLDLRELEGALDGANSVIARVCEK